MSVRTPPVTANSGVACFTCFDSKLGEPLKRCAGCRRVSYCSAECQKANWSAHKSICKALSKLEADPSSKTILTISLADKPSTDFQLLDGLAESQAGNKMRLLQLAMRRPLNVVERNLIGWEPRCMACTRTDMDIRLEGTNSSPLIGCTDCKLSFACSVEHWAAVRDIHQGRPCEDGHDGLSQCAMNREILGNVVLENSFAQTAPEAGDIPEGMFDTRQWALNRSKSEWVSIVGISWAQEFETEMNEECFPGMQPSNLTAGHRSFVASRIRGASNALSMIMTILYALEIMNDNNSWTKQEALTIHLIGASQLEFINGSIFEEILHRLPALKTLNLICCGSEVTQFVPPSQQDQVVPIDTCPDCTRHSRKRLHQNHFDTYHELINRLGDKFEKPDLAVAFNSGASQEQAASWRPTMTALVDKKIPTVFTAFNREEANGEASLLRSAGAKLTHGLGPCKNPWGSILAIKEPNKMVGYYAVNGWLAGGFK